jgi:hypothetical protein
MFFVSAGRQTGKLETNRECISGEEQAEPEHGSCHHKLESQPGMTFNPKSPKVQGCTPA